jgi:NAD(P)H-dependent flavin oxidoreductase YrpB (nitropropane dioxygenase family)
MRTKLAEDLGLEFPIFAFTHCRDVAAAVSKAGGLGVLGVAGHSLDILRMELEWIEGEVGDKPYGVDLLLPTRFVGSERGGLGRDELDEKIPQEHRRFVEDLLAKHDVPPLPADAEVAPEFSVGYENQRDVIELVFEHRIGLIASALGPPPGWMIEQGRAKGVKVAALAGTVDHARRHMEAGVDIVVAQGYEAGGHTGEISTMVLVPEVVDAVDPVPVLAAGGIGNGRQVTAALALGAQGVWTGSVWLTTEEAETHPVVKQKFLKASSRDTIRSRSLTGKPARQLRSAWTEAAAAAGPRGPGAHLAHGPQVPGLRGADQLLRGSDRRVAEPGEVGAQRHRGAGPGLRRHHGAPGRLGPGLACRSATPAQEPTRW